MQRYSVDPLLPSGLSLDPATGALSGTPTQVTRSTTYTIVAANAHGSSSFSINIVVSPPEGEIGDLVVHLLPNVPGSGWTTDHNGIGVQGLGSPGAPNAFILQRTLERAEPGAVVRVGPGILAPFSINFQTLGHQSKDIHFLNSTAEHPIILIGDASGGTIVTAPVNGPGGGALFSSAQAGAGHLHFMHFRFLQNWIGIELGSDTLAANNVTTDVAEGFWFVNCEIDGRYNYCKLAEISVPAPSSSFLFAVQLQSVAAWSYMRPANHTAIAVTIDKCPNKNPPGNTLSDGTLCAKSKWGLFGYAWRDVRVIGTRIHDIRTIHKVT
eukprot:COSAG02_NODE_1896_length_10463_cov_8.034253_3_plen_325_part_00